MFFTIVELPTSPSKYTSLRLKQLKYGTHKSQETPLTHKMFADSTTCARGFDSNGQQHLQFVLLGSHLNHR